MSNTAIVPITHTAQRIGARMIETLCRMGFEHTNKDGRIFRPCFADIVVYGHLWAVFEVDAARLWHFGITDLGSVKVTETLSAVLHKPVKAMRRNGLYYVVELTAQPKPTAARLPHSVPLDLDGRPGGDLLVPIGRGVSGDVWRPLPQLGHTLIVGATGSGKSTWLHCSLAALLTGNTPDKLQVVLIDPKQLELAQWGNAPHLRGQVAVDLGTATLTMGDLVDEMDKRGDLLAGVGARDLAGYNRRAADTLPYILCVIDECLDLTLQAGDKSELVTLLKRLASKARATGIILWLSATHGTADILPRVVSVNLASRVCFRVLDGNAAQVAGCPGAQHIPRDTPGRLLAKLDGPPQELQGYFLSDTQLVAIAGNLGGKPTAGPALPQNLFDLVTWAVSQNGGYLTLADIQTVGGLGQREARRLADQWERRGWLEKDATAKNKRRVTKAVCQIAEGRVLPV